MKKTVISSEKLLEYQSLGYWKGMTLGMCREYESKGTWPGITLHDFFYDTSNKFPKRDFIVHGDRRITFEEARRIVRQLASGLVELGFRRGDVICVALPNCPEFSFLQIALSQIGAIIQPIHLVYREYEIKRRIEFCGAKALVIPEESKGINYVNMIKGMQKELGLQYVFVVGSHKEFGEKLFPLERFWRSTDAKLSPLDGYRSEFEPDPNDILLLNFTSGTETDPKGFLHTHNTFLGNHQIAAVDICKFIPGKEVIMSFSPMTHTFGHMITNLASFSGATIVMVDTFDPGKTLELVQKEKITFILGTPTHLIRFLDHPDFKKYDISSFRLFATGGAPIPPALLQRVRKETRCELTIWYGMGEDAIHTVVWPGEKEEALFETVGKPIPGAELAIFDPEGKSLGSGEVGEIGFRGAAMFLGYFRNPEKTAATRNDRGWFLTGDLGSVSKEGYLRLRGRKKEAINRGGSKIFPLTIENILCFHPKIRSVAVVGVPDSHLGERVCACIIPVKGQTVTLEEIEAFVKGKGFSRHEIPDILKIVKEFPMTPTGKIKKDLLQKELLEMSGEN